MKRRNQKGLTLIELIVAFTVLLILTSMAVPLARARVRVERERELRAALREMYAAIDKYKDYCDQAYFGPVKQGTNCWPESLEQLVEGIKLANSPDGKKIRLLAQDPARPFHRTSTSGACAATRTIPRRPVGAVRMCSACTARRMRRRPMANLIPSGNARRASREHGRAPSSVSADLHS